jgi:hypothetical protein
MNVKCKVSSEGRVKSNPDNFIAKFYQNGYNCFKDSIIFLEEEGMWYYELNGQPFGPVSKQTVAEAIRNGKVNASTLVWHEGMTTWVQLGESELADLVGLTPPTVNVPQVITSVPLGFVPQTRKVKASSLKNLFWWWFGLAICLIPFMIISNFAQDQTALVGLMCMIELPSLASAVLQFILLY